jgi:hypothetical protein
MIEMRWVWHNLEHGAPPTGAVCVDTDGRLFQKLQYRRIVPRVDAGWRLCPSTDWSDWLDVPHSGVMHPNVQGQGRCAALSRSVPCTAGLGLCVIS